MSQPRKTITSPENLMKVLRLGPMDLRYFLHEGDELRKTKVAKNSGQKWKVKYEEWRQYVGPAS